MTSAEKCEVILKKIIFTINEGKDFVLCKDKGDWTAVIFTGSDHFSVGKSKENFDLLVDELYEYFMAGEKSKKKIIKENKK